MAPAGGHEQVPKLVTDSRGLTDVFCQEGEFPEIHIQEFPGIYGPGDPVFHGYFSLFLLVSTEYMVPEVQEVTIVGIQVERVPGMVHPVVGGGKDDLPHPSETGVAEQAFPYMDKGAISTVHEHDDEQHFRGHTQQEAGRGADQVGIRGFQEEMGVGDRKVHVFRGVVGAVQAPEQPYFMGQVVVEEVPQFPDDIAQQETVPPGRQGVGGQGFEQPDTVGDHGDGDKPADKTVKDIDQEADLIHAGLRLFVEEPQYKFEQEEQGDKGQDKGGDALVGTEGREIAGLQDLQGALYAQEAQDFIQKGLQEFHRYWLSC